MKVSRGNRRVAPTAHFTAQAWIAGEFPNAELFDTWQGRVLFGSSQRLLGLLAPRAPSLPWHLEFLYIRHHAFESRLRELEPAFVLEVGAGLSPRGLTFARSYPGTTYLEVDLAPLVAEKRRRLKAASLPPNYALAAGDLLDPSFVDKLPLRPKAGERTVVITEGVMDYLRMDEKPQAQRALRSFLEAAGGGHYLFDAYTRTRLAKYPLSSGAMLQLLSLLVGGSFEHRLFADAESAMAAARAAGFDAARVLDVAALTPDYRHPPMDYCHFELIEATVTPLLPAH